MESNGAAATALPQSRDVVIYHVWQSLGFGKRLTISFALIMAGFAVQAAAFIAGLNWLIVFGAGVPLIILGNILLLVRGYDNRVDFARFDPQASWETVERRKLTQLRELDKAIGKWDRSLLEITNWAGLLIFILMIAVITVLAFLTSGLLRVLVLDAAVLAVPHWFTGTRRVLRLPTLLVKVETMEKLLDAAAPVIGDQELEILMLLKGKETKIPDDVKFRISFKGQDPDFLGLYGQVVTNVVQGRSYPYFYAVLVARKGFGLEAAFNAYQPPQGIIKEFEVQDEVEVLIVRQFTTKTSGYHTNDQAALGILTEGFGLASVIPPKPA